MHLKLQTRLFSTTVNEIRNFNQLPGPKPSVPLLGTSWQYMKFIGKCLYCRPCIVCRAYKPKSKLSEFDFISNNTHQQANTTF